MYYGGFSNRETYALPVAKKRWWIERIVKELSKSHSEGQTQSRALHQNDPQTRELMGMNRTHTPSRLRRFS